MRVLARVMRELLQRQCDGTMAVKVVIVRWACKEV